MSCEEVREQLPDFAMGTLSETETVAVRRHLRGCAACRHEAAHLDEGVALFASAAHDVEPPLELKSRVMSVLAEEWAEAPRPGGSFWRFLRSPVTAAAAVLLVAAVTFGAVAQSNATRYRTDADSYRQFLHALGGRDVRVATLIPHEGVAIEGSAIMYDSDHGRSWVLVLASVPGYTGEVTATLRDSGGRSIELRSTTPSSDGGLSEWLVTSADLSGFNRIILTGTGGQALAAGVAQATPDS